MKSEVRVKGHCLLISLSEGNAFKTKQLYFIAKFTLSLVSNKMLHALNAKLFFMNGNGFVDLPLDLISVVEGPFFGKAATNPKRPILRKY